MTWATVNGRENVMEEVQHIMHQVMTKCVVEEEFFIYLIMHLLRCREGRDLRLTVSEGWAIPHIYPWVLAECHGGVWSQMAEFLHHASNPFLIFAISRP